MDKLYERFEITRPSYIADGHWACVSAEADRLWRSLEAKDASQALGDMKCLVESIAKIVLDIDGTPAAATDDFQKVVGDAHKRLANQPGHELVNTSPFGDMATQASKVVRNLAEIRNNYGGGHGRFTVPDLDDEMLHMALDGGLMWVRWALRRIGYFTIGRPTQLIEALVGPQSQNFTKLPPNSLKDRLIAANLRSLESRHQRSIGVAVGQRAAMETFMVHIDGVAACGDSSDLTVWPEGYRIGLVLGLWVSPHGVVTICSRWIRDAIKVLDPVPDCSAELTDLIDEVLNSAIDLTDKETASDVRAVHQELVKWIPTRPASETAAWEKLATHIAPDPFAF
ncbi:hypothetical protein CJ469_06181 [Nocardia farcinica]|uniref:hypothetical protein n=1 Tax=Nocardia farcinica TaxID=37329 RepID=UPI000BF3EB3B|nr:hypothetical protein [Nocardia farcinica]PFW98499.1 hypothetical protein CJ469_06181 [Nocardia farcinica]PFX08214.1 hypothetical protein CJ468_02763 [Nocardia farcinica]